MNRKRIQPGSMTFRTLAAIAKYKLGNDGSSPSIRWIGKHIGVKSTSQVDFYLNRLEKAGYIKREGTCNIHLNGGSYQYQLPEGIDD